MRAITKEKLWAEVLEKLADSLEMPAFESWIKPIKPIDVNDEHFVITTNNTLSKEWIYKNYSRQIKTFIHEIVGKPLELKINVELVREADFPKPEIPKNKHISLSDNQIDAMRSISNNLNLKYTFDTFVVGSHNKFGHAAARAVAQFPGKSHNPLFIYGGVGLGKTHLMQAIGHYILANHSHLKLKYTSTEMFTNDLINSIRNDKMLQFRMRFRQVDVLLLDDIQFIEGKAQTQEEIFHTFNDLYEAGKQIILTSDRPPKAISTLTERLRSRFEWGLLADIQVPDIETRLAILKNKVERDKMNVPNEVLEIIATAYQNNIRELEGGLNRVVAYVSINDCPMTVDVVRSLLNFSGSGSQLSIDKIIEITSQYFKLETSDLKGQSRSKDISHARQIAIYLTRDMTGSSFPNIGDAFGGRKHTTILYSFEKMKEERLTDKNLADTISEISKMITQNCL